MRKAVDLLTEATSFERGPDFTGEHRDAEDAAVSAIRKIKQALDEARYLV